MRKKIVAAALLLIACAGLARPQTVDLKEQRVPMTDLEGPWRFQAGDDPGVGQSCVRRLSLVAAYRWKNLGRARIPRLLRRELVQAARRCSRALRPARDLFP
jgi:hypothetical protein